MKVIKDKIENNLAIKEDTQLTGMIVGNVSVEDNKIFQLNGMIVGDLHVMQFSTAYINGMVVGNVINKGGRVEIFGIVNGKVIKESGEIIISPEARIFIVE